MHWPLWDIVGAASADVIKTPGLILKTPHILESAAGGGEGREREGGAPVCTRGFKGDLRTARRGTKRPGHAGKWRGEGRGRKAMGGKGEEAGEGREDKGSWRADRHTYTRRQGGGGRGDGE